ncbi:hypothetical protein LCGC14_2260190, partial [marine sediment metagenome]
AGQVGTLTFELVSPEYFSIVDSEVWLDDVFISPLKITGLEDYFFTDDTESFTLKIENASEIGQPNPYENAHVTIEVDGAPEDFLDNLVAVPYEWDLGPQQSRSLAVETKDFLAEADIKTIEEDRLYGVSMRVRIGQQGAAAPGDLLDTTVFVYRFLDAADSDHDDGMVEMMDTTNDGAGDATVRRSRIFDVHFPDSAKPTIELDDDAQFQFDEDTNTFIFDPTETKQDLKTEIIITSPEPFDREVARMDIQGDGELLKIFVDTSAFLTVLEDLADGVPGGTQGADANEIQLIDNEDAAGNPAPNERSGFINTVIARMETLLDGFREEGPDGVKGTADDGGWIRVTASTGANGVDLNDFLTDADVGATTLGRAHLVDNEENGGVWLLSLAAERAKYSEAEQNFRLSETLNEIMAGNIDVYVDRYFRYNNDANNGFVFNATLANFTNSLGKTFAHEVGHTVGLNHTSNDFTGGGIDIGLANANGDAMAQGIDENATLNWPVTDDAWRVALGLNYTVADAQNALDYFAAYRVTRVANPGFGDTSAPGDDPDFSPIVPVNDGALEVLTAPDMRFVTNVDFGTIALDGAGGNLASQDFQL